MSFSCGCLSSLLGALCPVLGLQALFWGWGLGTKMGTWLWGCSPRSLRGAFLHERLRLGKQEGLPSRPAGTKGRTWPPWCAGKRPPSSPLLFLAAPHEKMRCRTLEPAFNSPRAGEAAPAPCWQQTEAPGWGGENALGAGP